MREVFERIIDQLKAESIIVDDDAGNRVVKIIERTAAEYNNGWIPCGEKFPPEPQRTDDIEDDINNGRIKVYIVMIYGAEKPTTLYYAGSGYWYDEALQEHYPVIAWQPLPEPYRETGMEEYWYLEQLADAILKHTDDIVERYEKGVSESS